jgi:glycosyltransferase involved in cell wall biosynthesis
MTRALYFMPRTPEEWGGAAALWVTVAGWAGAGRRRGIEPTILTPAGPMSETECLEATARPAPQQSGTRYGWAPKEAKQAFRDAQRAVKMRRHVTPMVPDELLADVGFVWQHHELFHRAGGSAAARTNAPLVEYVHAPVVWEGRRWGVNRTLTGGALERFGERPGLLRADIVACVTQEVAERVVDFGVRSDKVMISPMGVDPERFSPDVDSSTWDAEFEGLGDFVVGWVGSFRKFHAIDLILESIRSLRSVGATVGLVLAGDGQDRPRLEARVKELGIHSYVKFVGQVHNQDMPSLLGALDAAVITADAGQDFHYSPLKLREYLASGTPVIVPNLGEMQRLVGHRSNGLLYEAGDVADLASGIEALMTDPELAQSLGHAGRSSVLETGTWDVVTSEVLDRVGVQRTPA